MSIYIHTHLYIGMFLYDFTQNIHYLIHLLNYLRNLAYTIRNYNDKYNYDQLIGKALSN